MPPPPSTTCPRCGTAMPADAPEGLCPHCLMAMNLGSDPAEGELLNEAAGTLPDAATLAGCFPQLEILECLGRGGMGAVYKARQKQMDRVVALEILAPERQGDIQFTLRFQREARALARLSHPNIVTVHDLGETGGFCYLIMEFVAGVTLRQLIQQRKLEPADALAIVPQICAALQYAHAKGIVHRDIKPENILIASDGQVKIADFGIAKIVEPGPMNLDKTGGRERLGTPYYMAPEQAERPETVDHRADIFSLGVVIYEMLTGELPLGRFPPPSRKVQVDVRLDEIVLRALEKEPELRYQSAGQVKTDLETIATPSPKAQASVRPIRSPIMAWMGNPLFLGALTFLLAIASGAVWFWQRHSGPAKPPVRDRFESPNRPLAPLPTGAVAWWRAEGNALDEFGRHSGSFPFGSLFAEGKVGQAWDFDGGFRRVVMPDSPALMLTNAMTLEAWVFPRAYDGFLFFRGGNRGGYDPWGMDIYRQGLVKFQIDDANNAYAYVTAPLQLNQWQHVAATWGRASGDMKIYVNGVLGGQTNTTLIPMAELDPKEQPGVALGNHAGTLHEFGLNGLLDEPAIYNRVLSEAEILAIYQAGSAGKSEPTRLPAPVPGGLIGWWRGEEDSSDVTGMNHGAGRGGMGFVAGKVGTAFMLDGVNDHIVVAASSNLDLGSQTGLTIEAWINPTDVTYGRPIIEWNNASASLAGLHMWVGHPGTPTGYLFVNLYDGLGDHIIQTAPGTLVTAAFQHVAVSYDKRSGIARLFINGVMLKEQIMGTITVRTTSEMRIGARLGDVQPKFFQGAIDELSIYNRALTSNEILAIYQAGSAGKSRASTQTAAPKLRSSLRP